jgi:NitT/TauT family transport system permease protein
MNGLILFLRRYWPAVLAHLALLAAWQLAITWGHVPAFVLPSPGNTLATLWDSHYNWGKHLLATAAEVYGGYLVAVVGGVVLALMTTWSRTINAFLMPVLVTLNMIPKVAMAPLFIVWLSYGIVPNIIITFTICFFPVILNTARGLEEVEPELLDLVRVLKASRWQTFVKIQFPSALPYIFSGMKVAAILAIAGAIVGEFIGSDRGLGFLIESVQANIDTAAMFMGVLLIALIGVSLYVLVLLLERWVVVSDARIR